MSVVNLQSTPIYSKSPYFIKIDEPNQTGSLLRMWIWTADNMSPPVQPTYVRDKLIPASNNTATYYNLSSFISEFFNYTNNNPATTTVNQTSNEAEWVYCKIERLYITATSGGYVSLDTKTYRCFYGYGYYTDGYNPDLGIAQLTPGYYQYLPTSQTTILGKIGSIRWIAQTDWVVKYTNLNTGATNSTTFGAALIGTNAVKDTPLVYTPYVDDGNKLEIIDDLGQTQYTYYMEPVIECKYTPVVCDFVNRYGAWQRLWFFKLSRESYTATNQKFNFASQDLENFDTSLGQRTIFNSNMIKSIMVHTGLVREDFNNVLTELSLAENIQIDGKPVILESLSNEYKTGVNDKIIQYNMKFNYAFDEVNTII